MNIFNKVTLQSLKKSRTRTIVTIIGVILSAAMITAVVTFGVSLLDYMVKGASQKYGSWHIAFPDADPSFVQEQAANGDTEKIVTFENIGYAALEGGNDGKKPYLFIAGFSQETFDDLPITLFSGRMPQNREEILVSGSVAAKGGVEIPIGSILSLQVGSRMYGNENLGQNAPYNPEGETLVVREERTYTVVGVCQTPSFEDASAPGYTLITMGDDADTAQHLTLFVTLKDPGGVQSYPSRTAEGHLAVFNNNVLRFMGLSQESSDKIFTGLLYSVGAIVVAIIMVGSIFLIYNSFHISLNERIQQFGILASVGATPRQLRNSVLFEGFCIGAVGIPIGVLAGIGSMGLVILAVAGNFGNILYDNVSLTLNVSLWAIAGAAAVSIATILISAYIPARKAANTPVMECIRQTNEVKVDLRAAKTSKLTLLIWGLEGTLALKNFKRNKNRYRSIVLSLVLSIVLFVSTSAFVTDLKQTAEQARSFTDYDIGFSAQNMDNSQLSQLYDRLKTAEAIYESTCQIVLEYSCIILPEELSEAYWESAGEVPSEETVELPVTIQFLDECTYQKIISGLGLPAEAYTGQNGEMIAVAKMEDNGSQAEDVSQLRDLFKDPHVNTVLVPKTGGAANREEALSSITCVEIVPPDIPPATGISRKQPFFFQVIAPSSFLERMVPSDTLADVLVKGMTFQSKNPSQSKAEIETMIQESGVVLSYILMNTSEMLEESRNYIFIANVFAYTFIIMISLIAAANVFNTISTNIKLRRRELAMLRSVGMSDWDFYKMMQFECAFYGIRALLFGLPLAAASSWLINKGMLMGGAEGILFEMPWVSMGISSLSVLLVIFVTMMYAVSRIKKENIIDALRDDMT